MGRIEFTNQWVGSEEVDAKRECYSAFLRYSLAMRHDWPSRVALDLRPNQSWQCRLQG